MYALRARADTGKVTIKSTPLLRRMFSSGNLIAVEEVEFRVNM